MLGSAGTGKTVTAVAAAIHHLVRQEGAAHAGRQQSVHTPCPQRALFLSFSRTAVAQIVDRATAISKASTERLEVSTFDGFAWRVLNDFGRFRNLPRPLRVISAADAKVPGGEPGFLYRELLPAAAEILAVPAVARHYEERYGLVVCDEFQDTSDSEWSFLGLIAPLARRILLADTNQCIYAELKGIDPEARITGAIRLPHARVIELPPASYRDPSGVLPAAAAAAMQRRFTDQAIGVAVRQERLHVLRSSTTSAYQKAAELVRQARSSSQTVSVFTHTNEATANLSDAFLAARIAHEQVGLTEASGEAVNAQLALLRDALTGSETGRRAVAVYITATTRGSSAPPFAMQILQGHNPAFERRFGQVNTELKDAADCDPWDVGVLGQLIKGAFGRFGTLRGQETWLQAASRFRTLLQSVESGGDLAALERIANRLRHGILVGHAPTRNHAVQVMNLHQTKGREADVTILVLQSDEFHGYEREPFVRGSRLLYVVMTRARKVANIIVPGDVHPLWQPLVTACETFELT